MSFQGHLEQIKLDKDFLKIIQLKKRLRPWKIAPVNSDFFRCQSWPFLWKRLFSIFVNINKVNPNIKSIKLCLVVPLLKKFEKLNMAWQKLRQKCFSCIGIYFVYIGRLLAFLKIKSNWISFCSSSLLLLLTGIIMPILASNYAKQRQL